MTGTADEGFGAHPFGEIARAMVATQKRTSRLVQAALESFTTTTRAQLELARTLLTPLGAQPRRPARDD
jgi:hypothetical protein